MKKTVSTTFVFVSILIMMLTMVSCSGKEDVPEQNSFSSEVSVLNGSGNDNNTTDESVPTEEEIREKITGLKGILEDLDMKRRNGSAAATNDLKLPGKRSMMIPLEEMQFVSRNFDENSHHGIDLVAQNGTEVYAAFDGLVADADFDDEFGNYVIIEHGGRIMTVYSHLQNYIAEIGTYVDMGDVIGYVGASGNATGPHLDFRVLDNGTEIDPEPFLNAEIKK